jgi:hypothetical protein
MITKAIPLLVGTERRALEWHPDHSFVLKCRLGKGLHKLQLYADLRRFEWDRLHYPMSRFGNKGQSTGPWDFDYEGFRPLLPAWRVSLNGRAIGLFYMQRVTVEDVASRQLRGEIGFLVEQEGEITLEARPYREFTLDPLCVVVEPDPFDRLVEHPWVARGLEGNWAHQQFLGERAAAFSRKIRGGEWEAFLRAAKECYLGIPGAAASADREKSVVGVEGLPALAQLFLALGDREALDAVRRYVRHHLELVAWGNPNPDGYGHNGDMGVATILKTLALVWNWLGEHLGELRAPLLARLVLQGDRFLEQQLLQAQYWGGAIRQDHGFRSTAAFLTAALGLLGHSDRAPSWIAFLVPRLERTLRILPTDGFIPFSSYHKISLYVCDMAECREALRFAGGPDLFAGDAFRRVPDYLLCNLDEPSMSTQVTSTRGDRKDFNTGLHFLFALARDFQCEKSRYLAHLLMAHYRRLGFRVRDHLGRVVRRAYEGLPFAILFHEEGLTRPQRPPTPPLTHFPDGGALNWRNAARRFNVAVHCDPPSGAHHALGLDLSATDLGLGNPSAGQFSVAVGRESLLQNAESGYRTGSHLANALLVDGKGQYGDNKDPMGVPMRAWRGHRIQVCRMNPDGSTGFARLNLGPAYPDEMQVQACTRDFHFYPDRVRVRDTVVCGEPHVFSFRFHTYRRHQLTQVGDLAFQVAHGGAALHLQARGEGLVARVLDVEVVWAYTNENDDERFVCIEISHPAPVQSLVVEFIISVAKSPSAPR